MPSPPGPSLAGEPEAETAAGTPWERRTELGLFPAWKQTIALALFEPAKLFAAARIDRAAAHAGFAVLNGSVFWLVGQLLERLLLRDQFRRLLELPGRPPPILRFVIEVSPAKAMAASAVATPLSVLVFLYLNAAITHGAALLFGQSRRGFAATFAACAYGTAPFVLFAVPGCGALVALVWTALLTMLGLREMHRMSSGGAAAVAFLPYVVGCCLGCATSLLLGTAASRAFEQ